MSGSLFGQITGKITDNGGNGLPGAAVALYQENTLVTGTSADENGVFSLTIEPGIYLPEFGMRSEIDVFLNESGPQITSRPQTEIFQII